MKKYLLAVAAAAVVIFAVLLVQAADKADKEGSKTHYELDLTASRTTIQSNEEGLISVAIKPTGGYEMHNDSPLKLTVTEAGGLEFGKTSFGKTDVTDPIKPVFKVPFKGSKPGKFTVEFKLHFIVCTAKICEIEKPVVKVPVEVKAAAGTVKSAP